MASNKMVELAYTRRQKEIDGIIFDWWKVV